MNKKLIALSALLTGALLAGCSGGLSTNGSTYNPPVQQFNLASDKLEFAVGTANYKGTTYLNTVVSFRQPDGDLGAFADTPTITGPSGFVVPSVSSAGVDAGTNHISGTPQVAPTNPPQATTPSTFSTSGGAFEYGFAPQNSTTTGAASYSLYSQPFYLGSSSKLSFYGGPPAYPFFEDGTYPGSFVGYTQGFTMFGATPVSGQYTLSVNVAAQNAAPQSFSASANLNAATVLGLPTVSTPAEDGSGGFTATVTPGTGATETLVYVKDVTTSSQTCPSFASTGAPCTYYYTIGPVTSAGTVTLPDNLAPCVPPAGQQHCSGAAGTLQSGDSYTVYAVSFDYPAFEAGPPGNKSQTPTITGSNGQADLSVSAPVKYAY